MKNKSYRKSSRRRGFSLIEILVAIAVLAGLTILIVPLFGKLSDTKNRTRCVSNLRTIGGLVALYIADNDGLFPPSRLQYRKDPATGEKRTVPFLADLINRTYLDHNSVNTLHPLWWCPGDLERPESMRKHSYGHNQFLRARGEPLDWDGSPNPNYDPRYSSPMRMQKSPSKVIFLVDFVNRGDAGKWSSSITAGVWPLRVGDSRENPRDARMDFSRHSELVNALFVDGSVRPMTFDTLVGTAGEYIHPYE